MVYSLQWVSLVCKCGGVLHARSIVVRWEKRAQNLFRQHSQAQQWTITPCWCFQWRITIAHLKDTNMIRSFGFASHLRYWFVIETTTNFFVCCRKNDSDILFWLSTPKLCWMQDVGETLNGIITSGRRSVLLFSRSGFRIYRFLSGWKAGISPLRRTFWQTEARWFTEPPRGSLLPGIRQFSIPVTSSLGNITPRTYRCLHIQVSAMLCAVRSLNYALKHTLRKNQMNVPLKSQLHNEICKHAHAPLLYS